MDITEFAQLSEHVLSQVYDTSIKSFKESGKQKLIIFDFLVPNSHIKNKSMDRPWIVEVARSEFNMDDGFIIFNWYNTACTIKMNSVNEEYEIEKLTFVNFCIDGQKDMAQFLGG